MVRPETDFNSKVIAALRRTATPEGSRSGFTIGGYEVRTHPDLVDRLKELMAYTQDARFEYVFGTPTLQNAAGKIFAAAQGTSSLCLRLQGVNDWGHQYEGFGVAWRQGSAWPMGKPNTKEDEDRIAELVRMAYSSVEDSKP